MSHWDFGYPPSGQRDAAPSSGAGGGQGPWAADDFWAPGDRWQAEGDWPAEDEVVDGGMAPYPITYERDVAVAAEQPPSGLAPDGGGAPAFATWPPANSEPEQDASYEPWPPAPYPRQQDTVALFADRAARWGDQYEPDQDGFYLPGGGAGRGRRGRPGRSHRGRGPARPRWQIPAAVIVFAAVTGASAILLTSGHPGGHVSQGGGFTAPTATPTLSTSATATASPSTPAASSAPITLTQAQAVLARYTTVNNGANAQRSNTLLAVAETGSSFAIDTGLYQRQRGLGLAPYPAFGPVQASYYIPRQEPAGGPRWFAVRVANAFSAHPKQVTSIEYLLFIQATPGGAWRNAVEPYLLPGATAPQVAVGTDGLATAVSPTDLTVNVPPGQLPMVTAGALDGADNIVADPGNLSDMADLRFWRGKLPGATVTDTHAPAAGANQQEFALRTSDGGALVFYTDTAELTITAQPGTMLHLTVPGFFSPAQALTQARMSYLEQFATYDPPAGTGSPRVVADYSGITGAN
ncbi:MAG TPA: hypothetical protein VMI73_23925 [Trebonia sp.]|nr:hypothetical protein [Trebonia sp.]